MKVDATPLSPVGSVSVKTSPDVTPGRDHVAKVELDEAYFNELWLSLIHI